MASCFKCKKPVYFAERIVATGNQWHKCCFACTECGKILTPGKHSEHKGLPYCESPCYFVLFGPQIYRCGYNRLGVTATEPAPQHFGSFYGNSLAAGDDNNKITFCEEVDIDSESVGSMNTDMAEKNWPELETRLAAYNKYYANTPKLQIVNNQVDDIYILEGQILIYWGLQNAIRFKEKDEAPLPVKHRHSYCFSVSNDLNGSHQDSSLSPSFLDVSSQSPDADGLGVKDGDEPVVMRRRVRKRRNVKRLSIINGHCYDAETSIFLPTYGSMTSVMVTAFDTCASVIRLLLDKFKVENYPDDYSLCIVKSSGETRALGDTDIPLLQRIFLGPVADDAKIFIVERHRVIDIPREVAPFVMLPEAVLLGFLEKCDHDEEKEIQWIRDKYSFRRKALEQRLEEVSRL